MGGQQPQLQFDNVITVIFHVTISNNNVLSRTAWTLGETLIP